MSEIISLHIGNAGCQVGNTMWELYCMESGISPNGKVIEKSSEEHSSHNLFYSHSSNNEYHPRCLFVDSDKSNIDAIMNSHPRLYNPNNFVSNNRCSGGIYSCRHSDEGEQMGDQVMEQVRRMSEACEVRPNFWLFNSIGGGTGSGIGSLVASKIQEEFGKSEKMQVAISPEPVSYLTPISECYNTFLSFAAMHETIDMSFQFSNKKMREVVDSNNNFLKVPGPYTNLNQLICLALSSVTYGSRFRDEPFQMHTIVPYPSMHYPLLSYYTPPGIRKLSQTQAPIVSLTAQGIHKDNVLLPLDPRNGYAIHLRLIYKGVVLQSQVEAMINRLHIANRVLFTDMSACKYLIEFQQYSPFVSPERDLLRADKSVCMLSNNTVFCSRIEAMIDSVSDVLRKKAFIHWYLREGVEKEEFDDARSLLESFIDDFIEVQPPESSPSGDD